MIKVYAGLSAQSSDVQSILPNARYAPPVQRDDILSDIEDGVNSILILDGLFHQALSVSPSEIMDALRRGIRVFGASNRLWYFRRSISRAPKPRSYAIKPPSMGIAVPVM